MIIRILILTALILILTTFAMAADSYFIVIDDHSGQSYAALAGFPGKYWGRTADKIYLAGGESELLWLADYHITYQARPFDYETSHLYLCYFKSSPKMFLSRLHPICD